MKLNLSNFFFKKSDIKSVLLSFTYFYLIITAYYILKPLRNAFLLELNINKISFLFLAVLFAVTIINIIYSYLIKRYSEDKVIIFSTLFFSINLLFFYFLFSKYPSISFISEILNKIVCINLPFGMKLETIELILKNFSIIRLREALITLFYIWVQIFSVFMVSLFWSFTNDIYNEQEGRTYYSFIGLGGLTGGFTGGIIIVFFSKYFSTNTFFLISAIFTVLTIPIAIKLKSKRRYSTELKAKNKCNISGNGLKIILSNRYIFFIALIVFTFTFSSSLFNYFQISIVKSAFSNSAQRASFYAMIFTATNILSFIIQIFLSPIILKYNFKIGILFVPVIQIFIILSSFAFPTILLISIYNIGVFGSRYSINRVSSEMFYINTSKEEKYVGKNFIDNIIFRLGDGMATIINLLFIYFGLSLINLNYIAVFFIIIQLFAIKVLFKEYNVKAKNKL